MYQLLYHKNFLVYQEYQQCNILYQDGIQWYMCWYSWYIMVHLVYQSTHLGKLLVYCIPTQYIHFVYGKLLVQDVTLVYQSISCWYTKVTSCTKCSPIWYKMVHNVPSWYTRRPSLPLVYVVKCWYVYTKPNWYWDVPTWYIWDWGWYKWYTFWYKQKHQS